MNKTVDQIIKDNSNSGPVELGGDYIFTQEEAEKMVTSALMQGFEAGRELEYPYWQQQKRYKSFEDYLKSISK